MIYLALYKGRPTGRRPRHLRARLQDRIIRLITRSPYAHCEIAVPLPPRVVAVETGFVPADEAQSYRCYSSSPRDGGVRVKEMPLPADQWDLLPLPPQTADPRRIARHYQLTAGAAYDWRGVISFVLPLGQSRRKWFCSEWCAAALGLPEARRQTPQSLSDRLTGQPNPTNPKPAP